MKVLFRLDAGQKYGWGHYYRCKSISQILKSKYNCNVIFLMYFEDGLEYQSLKENIFFIENSKSKTSEIDSILNIIKSENIKALVLDIRTSLSGQDILNIKKENVLVLTIDDPSERRMFVDYSFYSPLIQLSNVNWDKALGKTFIGWEWMPIRSDIKKKQEFNHNNKEKYTRNLFLSMGGSDSIGLIFRIINALDKKINMKINLVVGVSFKKIKFLEQTIKKNPNDIEIFINPKEITKLISNADLAICSFGMTAYELAYCAVKTLYICISEDHSNSADTFVEAGFGVNLGVHDKISNNNLSNRVNQFIEDFFNSRNKFSNIFNPKTIDGLAASRISSIIIGEINK